MQKPSKKEIQKAMKLAEKEIEEWVSFLYDCHEMLKNIDKKKTKKTK